MKSRARSREDMGDENFKEVGKEVVRLKEKELDKLADEIVDALLSSIGQKGIPKKTKAKDGKGKAVKRMKVDGFDKKTLMELAKLKNRMSALENRTEKYVKNFKIATVEAGRLVSEKAEEARKDNEQLLFDLHGQIEDLRNAMVKLGNRMKRLGGE